MSMRVIVTLALALISGWAFAVHQRGLVNTGSTKESGSSWAYFGAHPERAPAASDERPILCGDEVLRLVVGPVQEDVDVDWAAWGQVFPCQPGDRLEASVVVRVENVASRDRLADCHLEVRLDYFIDEKGESPLPTRAGLSVPYFPGETATTGQWTRVDVSHRAPDQAMSVRFSIVAWLRGESEVVQTFWLDHAELKRTPGKRRERSLWKSGER